MGRTKRKRNRLRKQPYSSNIDGNEIIVGLKRWMSKNNWNNITNLKLCTFETTSRGVCSSKSIHSNDLLIQIPYELLITLTTLQDSNTADILKAGVKLKFHDLLSLYLTVEKHKSHNSNWKYYIDSLPETVPLLPWLCPVQEIRRLPLDLKHSIKKRLWQFEESWESVKKSINPSWSCFCCDEQGDRVLNRNSFTWSYCMVNTRSVYVNPDIVRNLSFSGKNLQQFLSDDPCMALCPYLDMFNHAFDAKTEASLEEVNDKWIFQLKTLTSSKKRQQIFISYGNHDNLKLLVEYGFCLPKNKFNIVSFSLKDILEKLKLKIDSRQYKFIKQRNLDDKLYVGYEGISFNLKALLYVILKSDVSDWCVCIFNENYHEECLIDMKMLMKQMLKLKIENSMNILEILENNCYNSTENYKLILQYWKYWIEFLKDLIDKNIC